MRSVVGRTKLTAPAVQYQGLPDLLANVPSQINVTFGAALHDGYRNCWTFPMARQRAWDSERSSGIRLNLADGLQ